MSRCPPDGSEDRRSAAEAGSLHRPRRNSSAPHELRSPAELTTIRQRLPPGEEAIGIRMRDLSSAARAAMAMPLTSVERLFDESAVRGPHGCAVHPGLPGHIPLAGMLADDPDPHVHKAVGVASNHAGARDSGAVAAFLDQHAGVMPRVALRAAPEKLDAAQRARFLD